MEKIARTLLLFLVAASASAQAEERITVEIPPAPLDVFQREDFSVTAGGVVISFEGGFRSRVQFSSGLMFGAYGASDQINRSGIRITFSEPVKDIRFSFQFDEFFSDYSVNGSSIRSLRQPGPAGENIFYRPATTHLDIAPFVVTSWGFYTKVGLISFARANLDHDTVPTQSIRAPQRPPDASDLRVVVDSVPGLDTRCSYRSEGPLAIDIPVRRVVGPVDASGKLMTPQPLIAGGHLSRTANLTLITYDVDPEEIDRVYLNGHLLGNLQGRNNQWSENAFRFPVEWVNFGRNASGVNAEGFNALRIEIDQAVNTPPKWCTSVDWASLEFDAIAPIFLVHGTNADSSAWPSPLTDYLDSIGIPYSKEIELHPNGAIVENGELLASRLRELGNAFGARACHIVAHSKGGNDSRHFLVHHYDPSVMKVLSLSTLSTPFRGTVIADILELARANPGRESTNPFIKDVMSHDYFLLRLLLPRGPALRDNTTRVMLDYNLANPFPNGIKFYNVAADADYDHDGSISELEITSLFPLFLRATAEGSYHALATIKNVRVRKTERTVITRTGPMTVQVSLIEVDERTTGFEENDLVVTVRSAKHPSGIFLAQLDDNHGSMKSAVAMKVILSRIASDHPRRTP